MKVVGAKHDQKKARWDLFPWRPIAWLMGMRKDAPCEPIQFEPAPHLRPPLADREFEIILAFGAHKYTPGGWRFVSSARVRYFAAAMRHIIAWFIWRTKDGETGRHHLANAMCCIAFILDIELAEEEAKRRVVFSE